MEISKIAKSLSTIVICTATFTSQGVLAGGGRGCPVFTTAMVDAAAMATKLYTPDPFVEVEASDDAKIPNIYCRIESAQSEFEVDVNYQVARFARVYGKGFTEDERDYDTTLSSTAEELTVPDIHACRAEVLKSFVWNNYCAQPRGPVEN